MPRDPRAAGRLGFGLRCLASLVWLVAGAAKLPQMQAFHVLVERYGILPHTLAAPFASVLPFLEIGIGLYLAVGLFTRGTALLGTLLFAVFMTAQGMAMARGLSLDCGCFGTATRSTVGPLTMLRDMALGIPTFLMAARPARLYSLDTRLFGATDAFAPDLSRTDHTL